MPHLSLNLISAPLDRLERVSYTVPHTPLRGKVNDDEGV